MDPQEDDARVYKSIPDTANILQTLVDTINRDDLFQDHLTALQSSPDAIERKKAFAIKHTISSIQVFNTSAQPLFLAKDMGILLGIKHIKRLVREFEPDEKLIGYTTLPNDKTKRVLFLTRHGIYRCFYASRSPLAKLFRKFIGSLLDHMISHETELLRRISTAFRIENPHLIEQGMADLTTKMVEYETKYNDERKRAEQLELQCDVERQRRLDAEEESSEVDIINSYNMMHIEQLKQEKNDYAGRIRNIQNTLTTEDQTVDMVELRLLKEKYMKPVYVCILDPRYFEKLLRAKPAAPRRAMRAQQQQIPDDTSDIDDMPETPNISTSAETSSETHDNSSEPTSAEKIESLMNDLPVYKRNFDNIYTDSGNKAAANVELDEILYYHISFARNAAKADRLIHVSTQWVASKPHYASSIKCLTEGCDVIELNKLTLYKTTLEEIGEIIRDEFISLPP